MIDDEIIKMNNYILFQIFSNKIIIEYNLKFIETF